MRLPNLIETRWGRLTAFFLLYVTEGIPLGFCAVAIATQLRRMNVGPAEIGVFIGSFYLPWAIKWMFGPFIDVFFSEKLGRRRGWILGTQVLLVATLLACMALELPSQLTLLTSALLIHNTFGAMQDVAIDALAINVLPQHERGLASGVMFGGAAIGQAIGGSGVLWLMPLVGLKGGFIFVAACILIVTLVVVLPLREPPTPESERRGRGLAAVNRELKAFCATAFRSFVGTRGALAALGLAILPQGAMSLGLALQSNLSVEFGMSDDQIALLSGSSQLIGALATVAGGWASDRMGRRRATFIFFALMSLPVIYLMQVLLLHHYVMPVPQGAARPAVAPALITAMWVSSIAYAIAQGAMYGSSTALYMDVTNPRVAGTQFTMYMAMNNVGTSYSAVWQGIATETLGYPKTLLFDALTGLLCLLLVPLVKPLAQGVAGSEGDGRASARARALAVGLGLACLVYVPYRFSAFAAGPVHPIFELFFTLVFVAAAVFLGVSLLVGEGVPRALRTASALATPLLLAAYLRTWWPHPGWPYTAVAVLAGALLLLHARRAWAGLNAPAPTPATAG